MGADHPHGVNKNQAMHLVGYDVFHNFQFPLSRGINKDKKLKLRDRLDLLELIEFTSVTVNALSLADGNVELAHTCSEQHIFYPVPTAEAAAETFSF